MFNSVVIALVFNGLDILSGFIAAIKEKRVQSSKLRDGLFKKVGFILCYVLAILVDLYGSRAGIDFDGIYSDWVKVIDPKKRKPWYWDRKLTELKKELPKWATCPQEACNMRSDCRVILSELESNFNINNSYYRIQANSAMEAHSILLECDSCIDAFETDLHRMEQAEAEHHSSDWSVDY